MPLDSHSYLVSQGWSGNGTGLRHGAISRPLAIPQKKTLAGLGKDRDEAFPFWDHIFSAASKSIQLKVSNSSDDDSDNNTDTPESNLGLVFKRTSTGILSNRQPVKGTPATSSGSATPSNVEVPRHNLLAAAKREAARRHLYSNFFRGPVLGHDPPEQDDGNGNGVLEPTEHKKTKKRRSKDVEERKQRKERKRLKLSAGEPGTTAKATDHTDSDVPEVVKKKSKSKGERQERRDKLKAKNNVAK